MEYPPTPSRGLTASPESMEKSQQFGLGFDSDATPKPLRIGKRNASAAATPTPARNSIPRKPLPLRQASADVQSPLYARNTAIAPIHIPVRQSSTTFAQKLYGEGPSVIMGDAPTKETQGRVRSDSIASNSSRALSSLRDEEILAIKKHRHQRTISDTSSISTNAIRGIAQAEFRAENPPLNSGTTFYGPQRFDTDTGNASGDDEHPFYQKVQHRAASPGFDLDTENNSPVSPPIEWPLRTSSKEYAPVAPATSTTTDPFVDSQEVEFTRKNRFTRENRSKSLGNPEKVNPAPQSTSLKIKDKVLAMFHGRSVSISSTHSDRSDLTVRSTQSTRTKGKYKARQSQALQGFKLTQHVQEDAESVASSALSVRSELSSRSENSMATTTVDENGEPYRMSLPENAQLLGLELRIIPEVDCINPDTGRTIWIAVEAEARVRRRAILNAPNYGKGSIDAAIIIDETSYTSANCLRAAQHLAIATAHLLDPDRDRVAILTTAHCRSNHQHGAYVVYPLQKPSLLDIKTVCLAIRGPPTHSQPDDASFDASLRTAIHLLTSLKWEHGESAPPVYGHVFMLTAFAAGEILEGTEAVKVHILHPGVIPWRVEPPNFSNGWQLRSLYPQDIYNTALYQEDGGLPDHVRTLIHHARSGTDPGVISNFTWKMEPLGNCEIVNYYGDLDFDIMRPGEVATFFIQLKVGESVPGHADDPFKSSEPKSPTELIENLQTMLGDSVVDLLKMEVVYRNVLFSANTDLSVKSHCAVQRVNRSHSEWNIHPLFRSPDRTPSGSLYGTRAKVVMRLAFWTACNKGRQEAIKQIKAMCHEIGKQDGGGIGEVAQMFVKMVLEELTFQQLLQDRWFPWVNDDERNEEEARKLRVLIAALAKKREEEESAQSTSENATPISESSLSGSVQPGKNAAKNAREKARRQRVKMAKKAELEHDESVQSSENATPTSYEPSLSGSIQSSRMNTPTPQALQPQPLRTRANSNVLGVVQNTPSFSGSVQPRDTTPTQYEVGELQSQRLRGRVVSNFSGPVQDTPSSGLTEQFEDMSVATTPLGGGINTTNPVSGSYAGTPTRKNKVKKRGGGTGAGRTSDGSGSSGGEVLGGERTPSGGTTGPEPMAMPGWVRTTSGPGPTGQPMKFSDQRAAPPDPARQVWKGIRKDSYGEGGERQQRQLEGDLNQPISRTSTGTSTGTHTGTSMARVDDDEETKGIKDHALKNMRSLGAETIKSIKEGKKGGKGGKRGGGAKGGEPWLR